MNTPLCGRFALSLVGIAGTAALAGVGSPLVAQSSGGHQHADASHAVHESMTGAVIANPHMRMTPMRPATAADSARADKIVSEARTALARYKNVRVAEREGYRMFAPNVKQPVYHFTQTGAAIRAEFTFDVTRPTSLLYEQAKDGSFALVGAMYTAPKDATPEDLDKRVPLGIARWHLHTNMCVPRLRDLERWREVENGKAVFGPTSPIATREACDKVDGRFLPVVFNWMVHVNLFQEDPWADHH
jgi:hypothetical protein